MDNTAKEYAAALLLLGFESNETDAFADGLAIIHTQLTENPAYMDMLACPAIAKTERIRALREAFDGAVPDTILIFTQMMCRYGHIRAFPACYRTYMDTYRAIQKIAVAHIVSATPLTQADKKRLTDILKNKTGYTVHADYTVEPSLLGGIKIEMNGIVLDGSVKHRLQQLKEVIHP